MGRLLSVVVAAVFVLVGAVFATVGFLVLFTKLASPNPGELLFVVGCGLATFVCFWAANRLRLASLSKVDK